MNQVLRKSRAPQDHRINVNYKVFKNDKFDIENNLDDIEISTAFWIILFNLHRNNLALHELLSFKFCILHNSVILLYTKLVITTVLYVEIVVNCVFSKVGLNKN